jgi:hypothetical protein
MGRNLRIQALMQEVRDELGERRLPERCILDRALRRYLAEATA